MTRKPNTAFSPFAIAAFGCFLFATSAHAAPVGAVWTDGTTGTLDGNGFTVTDINGPGLATTSMSGSDFLGAPLATNQQVIDYLDTSSWTITFDNPVSNLRVYGRYWRGYSSAATYEFDQSFTILSGLSGTSIDGNTLELPSPPSFHDGILEFPGPLTSLSMTATTGNDGFQTMTFGVDVFAPGDCPAAPSSCTPAAKASLGVSNKNGKTRLQWTWSGEIADKAELGDPLTTNDYRLCLYDDGALVGPTGMGLGVAGGGECGAESCWKEKSTGYQYKNKDGNSAGVTGLSASAKGGSSKLQVKSAPPVPLVPALPMTGPVLAQLYQSENSDCYEATFAAETVKKNDTQSYKAILK